MIGCSHHSTPLEIRELLSFTDDQCFTALSSFKSTYPECECVLLNTCNRVELYAGSQSQNSVPEIDEMIRFVTGFHNQP
ncbi:MAG: glutamyl-tRNA reductase, partial [Pirellula sp.]